MGLRDTQVREGQQEAGQLQGEAQQAPASGPREWRAGKVQQRAGSPGRLRGSGKATEMPGGGTASGWWPVLFLLAL